MAGGGERRSVWSLLRGAYRMTDKCPTPTRECPWGAEEWRKYGETMQSIRDTEGLVRTQGKTLANLVEVIHELDKKVDGMNHVRRRGTAAGGVGGAIAAAVIIVGEYARRQIFGK